jgi:hypothetical protein
MYREFYIPNYESISTKIYNHIISHTDVTYKKDFWTAIGVYDFLNDIPEVGEVLDELNLSIRCIGVIYVPPNIDANKLMHIDSKKEIRGLLPVKNCNGSYTKFYDYGDQTLLQLDTGNGEFYYCPENVELCKEIGRFELTTPVFIDTSILHTVEVNPNINDYRISVSLGFDNPPKDLLFY